MTAAIPSRPPLADAEHPTAAERMHGFRAGERVRVTVPHELSTGRAGTVTHVSGGAYGVAVLLDGSHGEAAYKPTELEHIVTKPEPTHALTLFMVHETSATGRCSCGQEWGVSNPDTLRMYHADHLARRGLTPAAVPAEAVQWPLITGVPGPSPTDLPDDDMPVGEVLDVAPGALVRRPRYAKTASSSQAGLATLQGQAAVLDAFRGAVDAGLREARRLEDLDQAAQAIVDAADVWQDAEGDVDAILALSEAVKHWREVRDGGAR